MLIIKRWYRNIFSIQKVTIEVRLSYQPRLGDIYPIHREIREVVP